MGYANDNDKDSFFWITILDKGMFWTLCICLAGFLNACLSAYVELEQAKIALLNKALEAPHVDNDALQAIIDYIV